MSAPGALACAARSLLTEKLPKRYWVLLLKRGHNVNVSSLNCEEPMIHVLGLLIAGLYLASTCAQAQQSQDWLQCVNKGGAVSFDIAIGGCTAVIQSGKETRS